MTDNVPRGAVAAMFRRAAHNVEELPSGALRVDDLTLSSAFVDEVARRAAARESDAAQLVLHIAEQARDAVEIWRVADFRKDDSHGPLEVVNGAYESRNRRVGNPWEVDGV